MPKMNMTNLAVFNLIAKHLHATNPKDQIYGLLSIMDLIIEIDYSDSRVALPLILDWNH
jgi:hypothetical protein